uniref:Uncharacterized protein n=1 Tax=Lactuca sativa TaxID=4236 RepID=A0A9R1VBJ5_LACSA|nr:hypothetical protein LSAT_V11C600316930 [Lactuca sativa]
MSPNAKGKVVIEELPVNDDQEAEVQDEVHGEYPLRNMDHVNDEPIYEYMSLIIGNSKKSEGSCSMRLNLDGIDELKEKTADQDATTCVMDNEAFEG